MTGTLEFAYRHKSKVVFGFLTFLAVCLAAVAGLAYFFFTGNMSGSDFRGQRGGKLLIAIPFAIAIVVLKQTIDGCRVQLIQEGDSDIFQVLLVDDLNPSNELMQDSLT